MNVRLEIWSLQIISDVARAGYNTYYIQAELQAERRGAPHWLSTIPLNIIHSL